MHDFRFSQLTAAAKNAPFKRIEQRQASATVTIDQVRRNKNVWEVGVRRLLLMPTWLLFALLGAVFAYAGRRRRRVNVFAN